MYQRQVCERNQIETYLVFLLCFEMFCSFTQKYPPVKFLSEKDRKRILVSLCLRRSCFGEIPKNSVECNLFCRIKDMRRDEGNYLGCHMSCTGFRVLLHLFVLMFSNSSYEQYMWTLLLKFDFPTKLLFPVTSQDHIAKEALCALSDGLKFQRLGEFFKHILTATLCDQIGRNLVIRLEKKLLCRECSSPCIFSVDSVILKHHKQLRGEEDSRLSQDK